MTDTDTIVYTEFGIRDGNEVVLYPDKDAAYADATCNSDRAVKQRTVMVRPDGSTTRTPWTFPMECDD